MLFVFSLVIVLAKTKHITYHIPTLNSISFCCLLFVMDSFPFLFNFMRHGISNLYQNINRFFFVFRSSPSFSIYLRFFHSTMTTETSSSTTTTTTKKCRTFCLFYCDMLMCFTHLWLMLLLLFQCQSHLNGLPIAFIRIQTRTHGKTLIPNIECDNNFLNSS